MRLAFGHAGVAGLPFTKGANIRDKVLLPSSIGWSHFVNAGNGIELLVSKGANIHQIELIKSKKGNIYGVNSLDLASKEGRTGSTSSVN